MRLISLDGARFELSVEGYQYPSLPGGNHRGDIEDWDANWLMVRGSVCTADGQSWTFSEPCLTTREALAIGGLLQRVAAGTDGAGVDRTLEFVEPEMSFEVVDIESDPRTIKVHLSRGCAPPVDPAQPAGDDEPVVPICLRMGSQSWQSVARAWATESAAYPPR